jgi:hypothetical protein
MNSIDYYKAPSQEVFDDIKINAIKIWKTYDNTYGYVDEKLNRIKDMKNISDNAWTIVAMFDGDNQMKLLTMVKKETAEILSQLIAN